MKKFAFLMFFISQTAIADWDNPNRMFDMKKNTPETMTITLKSVDNVQRACEAESKKRLGGNFGYAVNACSFWEGSSCIIIVPHRANMHTLGHELLHCYQGNWH